MLSAIDQRLELGDRQARLGRGERGLGVAEGREQVVGAHVPALHQRDQVERVHGGDRVGVG
jgi:hypothetical protein